MTLKSTITSPFLPFIFLVLVLEVSAQGQENEKQSDDSKANPAVVESETSGLTNGDFEELDGEVPKDWVFPTPGVNNYRYSVEEGNAFTGNNCVLIDATQANNFMGFASFSRTLDLSQYLGQRIRYRAAVRVESESKGRAQLWLRCDTVNDEGETVMQAFDNMQNRPITEPQWQHYEIVADVSDDTEEIIIGVLVIGRAKVWFDDVTIEVVEDDVSTTTMFGAPRTRLIRFGPGGCCLRLQGFCCLESDCFTGKRTPIQNWTVVYDEVHLECGFRADSSTEVSS